MGSEIYSLLLALGIFSIGFISIGPNILSIIGTSMERGRDSGIRLALGVGAGSGIWAALTVAGLTALVTAYANFMIFLKVFGAVYLLWLAYKAFKSAATPHVSIQAKSASGKNLFFQGVAIQLTNPKAALHWVAIVGLGLGNSAPLWAGLTLIIMCTVLSMLGHTLYAVTFSTQPVIVFYRRFRRWIDGTLGVFFTAAAYKIAAFRS